MEKDGDGQDGFMRPKVVNPVPQPTQAGSGSPFRLTAGELESPELAYPLSEESCRGVCLLFNHKEFDPKLGQSSRSGTDADADAIERVFKLLRFDVRRYLDAKYQDYIQALNQIKNMDHSRHDSFVCVILSHGDDGIIFARDSQVPLDSLIACFRGDHCPSLTGKPKLFFIQACRGANFDKGTMQTDSKDDLVLFKLPVEADILVANATNKGYFAWRNSTTGSWFIQELYKVLLKDAQAEKPHDIQTLMTVVARKVAALYESNTGQAQSDCMKQMTSVASTLTRLCYITNSVRK